MVRARVSASAASRRARSRSPAWTAAVASAVSAWSQVIGVTDGAGEGFGAVRFPGPGGGGGQHGDRPGLLVGVADGAGEGLGTVQVPGLDGGDDHRGE